MMICFGKDRYNFSAMNIKSEAVSQDAASGFYHINFLFLGLRLVT